MSEYEMMSYVAVGLIAVLFYLAILGVALANYIIGSIALYKLADQKRINNPWLAWIPVLNAMIIGKIADKVDGDRGIERSWGKVLLILSLIALIGVIGFYMFIIVSAVAFGVAGVYVEPYEMIGFAIPMYLLLFVMAFAGIAQQMCRGICLFKIYEEIAPTKAVKYIILSCIVPLAEAICLKKCQKKYDEEMVYEYAPPSDIQNFDIEQ